MRSTAPLLHVRRLLIGLAFVSSLAHHPSLASYRVAGTSMAPTFLDGDRIVVAELPGFCGEPRVGETVIADVNGEIVIKRVVGVPGDRPDAALGRQLADGEYFLLGDHRRVSVDSRDFGPVRRESLLGRVILRVPMESTRPPGVLARHAPGR